eukprot:CAMPEP_0178806312 /NCGR_PEP_ID=MMETSP0745-20121128/16260_1 /TAXON_ID=913974 /ORGANISM="Nitzschia punctata, Strain CCMP561" /LENGTH=53 /DNA_ID=CAMNT_0020466099 /DNA_START=406 /DNA_END=564 /DNA_ORIENTATION=+
MHALSGQSVGLLDAGSKVGGAVAASGGTVGEKVGTLVGDSVFGVISVGHGVAV